MIWVTNGRWICLWPRLRWKSVFIRYPFIVSLTLALLLLYISPFTILVCYIFLFTSMSYSLLLYFYSVISFYSTYITLSSDLLWFIVFTPCPPPFCLCPPPHFPLFVLSVHSDELVFFTIMYTCCKPQLMSRMQPWLSVARQPLHSTVWWYWYMEKYLDSPRKPLINIIEL